MPDTFIVENFQGFKAEFPLIEAKDLEAYDIVVDSHGNLFEVNDVEEQDGMLRVDFTIQNGINEGFEGAASIKINESFGLFGEGISNMINEWDELEEAAETGGKKVKLNKIMRGDVKKYKVYVKNDKGNVVKVNFGDPNMEIKRDDPARRRNFRARHNCDTPGPKWKARYWACKTWAAKPVSKMLAEETELNEAKNKPKNPKKWRSCISQAKAKFDVYPSAYANAWASKCYKKKKGKWKKVAEDFVGKVFGQNLNESKNIESIENGINLNKNGKQQAIDYLKQFFGK